MESFKNVKQFRMKVLYYRTKLFWYTYPFLCKFPYKCSLLYIGLLHAIFKLCERLDIAIKYNVRNFYKAELEISDIHVET